MKVFVLDAIRKDNSIDMRSGTWRCPAIDYEILSGELVNQIYYDSGVNEGNTIYHVKKDDGRIYFFEEYFKTEAEAVARRKELLGIK